MTKKVVSIIIKSSRVKLNAVDSTVAQSHGSGNVLQPCVINVKTMYIYIYSNSNPWKALALEGPISVCRLAQMLPLPVSAVSTPWGLSRQVCSGSAKFKLPPPKSFGSG